MNSNGIISWRTALRYLARGDSRAKRLRLAVILLAHVAYLLACGLACAMVGLFLAQLLL